jgi:hypothetical protein
MILALLGEMDRAKGVKRVLYKKESMAYWV